MLGESRAHLQLLRALGKPLFGAPLRPNERLTWTERSHMTLLDPIEGYQCIL